MKNDRPRLQGSHGAGEKKRRLKESKPAEAVLADPLAGAVIENVDQHVLFGMTGEKARKNFDEFFLVGGGGLLEAFADV